MKWFLLISLLLCVNFLYAQINIKSAGSENGIVISQENGMNLGYDFSKSEARFIYGNASSKMVSFLEMKNGNKIQINESLDMSNIDMTEIKDTTYINPFKGNRYKLILPTSDSKYTLLNSGKFNPGIGLSYDRVWSRDEFRDSIRYGFVRIGYELKQNKFGRINQGDSISIGKKGTHTFTAASGFNWLYSEKKDKDNFVLSISLALQYNINPVSDLKAKEFVIYDSIAVNGAIQETELAYFQTQENHFALMPRLDFAWTPLLIKNKEEVEIGPRIGILGSLSMKYNINANKQVWSFSIGPSMHPKWSTTNVITTLQFEFLDFSNNTDNKSIEDIFAIVFYVGVPLSF